MKHCLAILLCWAAFAACLISAPHPEAKVTIGSSGGIGQPALTIGIVENDEVKGGDISIARSSAVDPSGKNIIISTLKDGEEKVLPAPLKVTAPDNNRRSKPDGWATQINIFLAEPLVKDTEYRIMLRSSPGEPVLTFRTAAGEVVEYDSITLNAGKGDPIDLDYLESVKESEALTSSVEVGGGDDGSLFAIKTRYVKKMSQSEEIETLYFIANLEANLTFDEEKDAPFFGKVLGELDGLWLRDTAFGRTFIGLNGSFDSDQDFDNWDSSLGLTTWTFVQNDFITGLGNAINLGEDRPVHPLSLKLKANYIYESEREEPTADPEEFNVSARAIWLARLYSDAPFLNGLKYNINLVLDGEVTWEPESSDVHPESRIALEFSPVESKDSKMAFTLTYAKGEFSPTYADEDAFLAGLKMSF